MSNHIIHRQQVVLKTSRHEQAHAVQDAVSRLVQQDLPQLLEAVFDEVGPPDEIVRMDTLRLDLGEIDPQHFETEFKQRLITALKAEINNQKNSSSNGTMVLNRAQSLTAAFTYFMESGSLPWHQSKISIATWEAEMEEQFSKADWLQVQQWLQENASPGNAVLRRLTNQFSGKFLEKLLPLVSIFPAQNWSLLYADLQRVFSKWSNSRHVINQSIWLAVANAWLQNLQGAVAVKAVIKEIAELLRIPIADWILEEARNIDLIRSETVQQAIRRLTVEIKEAAAENAEAANLPLTADKSEYPQPVSTNEKDDKQPADIERQLQNGTEKTPPETRDNEVAAIAGEKKNNPEAKAHVQQKARPQKQPLLEVQYVSNCGLVLLHPFLEMYFTELELVRNKAFVTTDACSRAVLLLHYLATGETEAAEFNLVLQKLLCGLPDEETLPNRIDLTDKEMIESAQLLQTVVNYWPPLKNTSSDGLRQTFLQREGRLEPNDSSWLLTVEQKTLDILLNKLPWGISTIRMPWMKTILSVDWV